LVLKPEKVKNNEELLQQLQKLEADVYVVVSYGKILPKELIDTPPLKTLNIHFSLLPLYRGAAPIQAALKNGDFVTGTTIFVLDEFLDHGPVLTQVQANIHADDTFPTLASRMASVSAYELIRILPLYEKGQVRPREQDHTKATKAPMIKKEDGKIDWTKSAQEIYNKWRAYQPWPGVYTSWNGKLFKIIECKAAVGPTNQALTPGTVLPSGLVACGQNTCLQIVSLQPEGKQSMSIQAFLNGNSSLTLSSFG
jgi:methionyl-tRNA formyltransferase